MKTQGILFSVAAVLLVAAPVRAHYDIAPYFSNGQLLTGGLDHSGAAVPPVISVYLYDFGEDQYDPFNPTDPGVNQQSGVGNLPAGATLHYNILSSLTYWNGMGVPAFTSPTAGTYLSLLVGTTARTLDGDSGAQAGSFIQSVASNGSLHKHFVSSLFADAGTSNVPGDAGYAAPAEGIYAIALELTMSYNATQYVSEPFWMAFNNGLTEEQHDAAGAALGAVPEPASLAMLALGAAGLLCRRGRRRR